MISNGQDSANKKLEDIINEVKDGFKSILAKRKDLVLRLGRAIGRESDGSDSVCEQIKHILKEEIAEGLISARAIEQYSPDDWKKRTKPKRQNEKIAFFNDPAKVAVAVTTDGLNKSVTHEVLLKTYEEEKEAHWSNRSLQTNECAPCKEKDREIEQLKKALETATQFVSADAMREKTAFLDLTRFGQKLSGLINKHATTCSMELDETGKVIDIISEEGWSDL